MPELPNSEFSLKLAQQIAQGSDSTVYLHPFYPGKVIKLYDRDEYQGSLVTIERYRDLTIQAAAAVKKYPGSLRYRVVPIEQTQTTSFYGGEYPLSISEYVPGPTLASLELAKPTLEEELQPLHSDEQHVLRNLSISLKQNPAFREQILNDELASISDFLNLALSTQGVIISSVNVKPRVERKILCFVVTDIAYNIKYITFPHPRG